MSNALPIQNTVIIGAMTPPRSKAPFNRANLVVRGRDGEILQVRAYTSEASVEGPAVDEQDWNALIATEQALALPESTLVSGAALWVLRPRFPRRERALHDLRASGVLLHEHIDSGDAWLCLVNESKDAASTLRDRWHSEAIAAAKALARSRQWPRAQDEAEIAHTVARGLDPDTLALLILTYEQCGRDVRARGTLTMAGRSRGADFATQISERLGLLRHDLSEPAPTAFAPTRAHTHRSVTALAMRSVARRGNEQSLHRLSLTRTAA